MPFPFALYLTAQDAEPCHVSRPCQTDGWAAEGNMEEVEQPQSFLPFASSASPVSVSVSDAATGTTEVGAELFDWAAEVEPLLSALVEPLQAQALLEVRHEQRREAAAAMQGRLQRRAEEELSRVAALEERATQRETQKRTAIEDARAQRSAREEQQRQLKEVRQRQAEAAREERALAQRASAELRAEEEKEAGRFLQTEVVHGSAQRAVEHSMRAGEALRWQLKRTTGAPPRVKR